MSGYSFAHRQITEMRIRLLIFSVLFVLTACSPAVIAPPETGIEGQVFVGPMCPVMVEGQDCPDQPYQATLTVLTPDGREVTQFQTEDDGSFRFDLPPGEYILHPEPPPDSPLPYASEQPFSVIAGQYTHLIINYDSGIR